MVSATNLTGGVRQTKVSASVSYAVRPFPDLESSEQVVERLFARGYVLRPLRIEDLAVTPDAAMVKIPSSDVYEITGVMNDISNVIGGLEAIEDEKYLASPEFIILDNCIHSLSGLFKEFLPTKGVSGRIIEPSRPGYEGLFAVLRYNLNRIQNGDEPFDNKLLFPIKEATLPKILDNLPWLADPLVDLLDISGEGQVYAFPFGFHRGRICCDPLQVDSILVQVMPGERASEKIMPLPAGIAEYRPATTWIDDPSILIRKDKPKGVRLMSDVSSIFVELRQFLTAPLVLTNNGCYNLMSSKHNRLYSAEVSRNHGYDITNAFFRLREVCKRFIGVTIQEEAVSAKPNPVYAAASVMAMTQWPLVAGGGVSAYIRDHQSGNE